MPKLTVQVRTRDNLQGLLASGESAAWRIARTNEPLLTHVQVVSFDGTKMIAGVYDRAGSHRRSDGRLIIRFFDGRIVDCDFDFAGQNPVRYVHG